MSLVRYVVVSLSVMDCLYPRDPSQPCEEKERSTKESAAIQLRPQNATSLPSFGTPAIAEQVLRTTLFRLSLTDLARLRNL